MTHIQQAIVKHVYSSTRTPPTHAFHIPWPLKWPTRLVAVSHTSDESDAHNQQHFTSAFRTPLINMLLKALTFESQSFLTHIFCTPLKYQSHSISFSIPQANDTSRVRFPAGAGNFPLHHRVKNRSGAHPASYSMGTGALSVGVRRTGREADHSPLSSAEVKECVQSYFQSPNTSSWSVA